LSGIKDKISDLLANFDKGHLIGIDVGLSAVKLAKISPFKKTYKLDSYESVPLAEATIIEDEVQKPDDVINAIRDAFDQMGIKQKIACIGIDGPNTITKRLQVPSGTNEEVEDNILWESEQYIPFGVDESEIDFFIIRDIKEQDVKDVIVAASRVDISENYSNLVKEAGLIPKIVDLNVFAITNLFEIAYANDIEHLSDDGTIIIDFGAQKSTIIVYKNQGPVLTREIPFGGVLVTEEIQRQMGLSYDEAEDLKTMGDDTGNLPEEILGIVEMQLDKMMEEVKKILNFYIAAGSSEQVGHCFVTGGSSLLPGFTERLGDLLNMEINYLNPFESMAFDEKKFNESELSKIAATGVVAMGLGLRKI